MKQTVEMTVTMTLDVPEWSVRKDREEVEGLAYWILQPRLESASHTVYDGCSIMDFDIKINN